MPIFFRNMDIVVPGDIIAKGKDYKILEGAFKHNDKVISEVIGIVYIREKTIKVVPLEGRFYIPKVGDIVMGIVIDYSSISWTIDIKAPYVARLDASDFLGHPIDPARDDITKYLNVGDILIAKVAVADRLTHPQLVAHGPGLGRIIGGRIVFVSPQKIPRILGKNQSMIKMIREITKVDIRVCNNGYIWFKTDNEELEKIVIEAIMKIAREAHVSRLTERIRKYLLERIKET